MSLIRRISPAVLAFLFVSRLCAQDAWVIAAEEFSLTEPNPLYAPYSKAIPSLLLGRISTVSSRMVLPDELQARKLKELSDAKLALVKSRSDLLLSRDKILFSAEDDSEKEKKRRKAADDIAAKQAEIDAKSKEIDVFLSDPSPQTSMRKIGLWKDGNQYWTRKEGASLASELKAAGVSALLTGTVEDIAGYACVSASFQTGLPGLPAEPVVAAGAWEDLDQLVTLLALRLTPTLSNRPSVVLRIKADPAEARVFLDGSLLDIADGEVRTNEGEHVLRVEAPGYRSAEKKAAFFDASEFDVAISLEPLQTVQVAFNPGSLDSTVYIHDKTLKTDSSSVLDLVPGEAVGNIETGNVRTWFVLDIPSTEQEDAFEAQVRLNKTNTEKRMEKARKTFYWSLGALYLSLPPTLMLQGKSLNMYRAYNEGRLEQTADIAESINAWTQAAAVSRGVSIGLGINLAVQLVRYILAAEQAVPRRASFSAEKE